MNNNSGEQMNSVDEADAQGIFGFFSRKIKVPIPKGIIHGSHEDEDYFMGYPKRGKCLIFNNKVFEKHTKLNERKGTDIDAAKLSCRFQELNFDVHPYHDLKAEKIEKRLRYVAREDHSGASCFVCCILSHGDRGVLYGKDGEYLTEQVFAPFYGDACPSLAGKPKIFLIQACQGDKLDDGVDVTCKQSSDADGDGTFRISTRADFLIVYSTVPGFFSWRNPKRGSWFVEALCAAMDEYAYTRDFLQLLTIVNRRVSYDFKSFTPEEPYKHMKKQVPCITSTLTRNIRFPLP